METNIQDNLTYKINSHLKPNRFGKGKFTKSLLSNTFFSQLIKEKEYKKTNNEMVSDWGKIVDAISTIITEEPDGVNLGNNMGEFKLGLLRLHNAIDPKLSSELNKPIKYSNYSTNRKNGKVIWKTEYARKVNFYLKYLGFKACRKISDLASKAFIENGNIYKDVTKNNKLIK